jgi:hypothetical protein
MSYKRKSGKRVDAKGRSTGGSQHIRLYLFEMQTAAFRSLSVGARALLLELKAFYNGNNNGALFLSAREAAKRLNIGKNKAGLLFCELQERGFIRAKEKGAFNIKATRGGGAATTWVLTEFAHGTALPTRDFQHWKPAAAAPSKKHSAVPPAVQTVPLSGTVPFKSRLTVPPTGTVAPFIGLQRYHQRYTDNIPREAEPLSCRAVASVEHAEPSTLRVAA